MLAKMIKEIETDVCFTQRNEYCIILTLSSITHSIEFSSNVHDIVTVLSYLFLLLAMYDSNRLPNKNVEIPNKNKYFNVMNISRYTQNIPNSMNMPGK